MRSPCALALGSIVLSGIFLAPRFLAAPPGSSPAPAPRPRVAGPAVSGGAPHARAADVVLRGGAVYTMDAVRSWAEAVAIRRDTIVYAGPDAGVAPYVGPRTKVVNLSGRMVLPAFQDSHIHPISGGISHRQCALYDFKTREDYVGAVAKYAQQHPQAAWIRGDGWSLAAFAPSGVPDRKLLDAVVSDRPVYLESSDGHSAWVNSRALSIAKITKDTPDPPGGRIDRDPKTGEPLGGLQDSAMDLVARHAPPYTPEDRREGLRFALKMLNGLGITSLQDASVQTESLEAYRALNEKGELTMRVVASLWWERDQGEEQIPGFIEARRRYTRGRVRATTVKIMQDGVMEVQTAAMLEPYKGKPGVRGLTMVEPEALKKYVTRLDQEGFQVHFHAIGDAAIRECLDAVEAARSKNGARDSRHHISHLEIFHPADIPRFRALGVVANFQPLWAYADDYIVKLTLPFLEPERARWLYPIGSL
ncbi:MAG: amidohydrolase, partial [Acidobacteriota bacterium]